MTSPFPTFANGPTVPACRGADTNLFFPPPGSNGTEAKVICARCPLRVTCRDWALAQPATTVFGIWGGMTDNDRERWRTVRARARTTGGRRFTHGSIAAHHDTIATLLARGRSWQEIAAAIGFSREGVRKYWRQQEANAQMETTTR